MCIDYRAEPANKFGGICIAVLINQVRLHLRQVTPVHSSVSAVSKPERLKSLTLILAELHANQYTLFPNVVRARSHSVLIEPDYRITTRPGPRLCTEQWRAPGVSSPGVFGPWTYYAAAQELNSKPVPMQVGTFFNCAGLSAQQVASHFAWALARE